MMASLVGALAAVAAPLDDSDVVAQSLGALSAAEAAVAQQLAATAAQLAGAAAPPPAALLETIAKCAEAVEALHKARKAVA